MLRPFEIIIPPVITGVVTGDGRAALYASIITFAAVLLSAWLRRRREKDIMEAMGDIVRRELRLLEEAEKRKPQQTLKQNKD